MTWRTCIPFTYDIIIDLATDYKKNLIIRRLGWLSIFYSIMSKIISSKRSGPYLTTTIHIFQTLAAACEWCFDNMLEHYIIISIATYDLKTTATTKRFWLQVSSSYSPALKITPRSTSEHQPLIFPHRRFVCRWWWSMLISFNSDW